MEGEELEKAKKIIRQRYNLIKARIKKEEQRNKLNVEIRSINKELRNVDSLFVQEFFESMEGK